MTNPFIPRRGTIITEFPDDEKNVFVESFYFGVGLEFKVFAKLKELLSFQCMTTLYGHLIDYAFKLEKIREQ